MAFNTVDMNLCIVSYNLHGFNQGSVFLKNACENLKYDVIFIQEHWLSPDNMYKLKHVSNEYKVYGQSAMEKAVSIGFLRGRPFGGVAIMIKNKYENCVSNIITNDRYVSLTIGDCNIVNVHMPCDSGSQETFEESVDIVTEITNCLEASRKQYIIFGGDLNVNLKKSKTKQSILLNEFIVKFNLFINDCSNDDDDTFFTFSNDKLGRYSVIDYICVSNTMLPFVINYDTCDSELNHSDHMPVLLSLDVLFVSSLCVNPISNSNKSEIDVDCAESSHLRWDHCNTQGYYELTGRLLYPIYNNVLSFYDRITNKENNVKAIEYSVCIDRWYDHVVDALRKCADCFIPCYKQNTLKSWWNDQLNDFKTRAMQSHRIWDLNGRPRNGQIFLMKNNDKLLYKAEIRRAKQAEENSISNELYESLVNKKSQDFWKTWNNKLNKNKNKSKITIVDGGSDKEICEKFADFFQKACTPNTTEFHDTKQEELNIELTDYIGDYITEENIMLNAEAIAIAVCKLNNGKAPGFDGITLEHILHCHPIIYTLLAKVFSIILKTAYVPTAFGRGTIIPIPKTEVKHGAQKIDSFRGITLSPIFSKIFEHCLVELFGEYLYSSDNQLGFKPKVGCTHAIYIMREVVDYYVNNDTTVNLCLIDVAKAFDKVCQAALFLKLMKRHVPVIFITILKNWYNNVIICVKWYNSFSRYFHVAAGVRQGGILSPILFLVYVNEMLIKLSKCGCSILGHWTGALMYADDLVLMAPSLFELQFMVNLCEAEMVELDLKINSTKSVCLRIGKNYDKKCNKIKYMNEIIPWVAEARYLGVYLMASTRFTCNFAKAKTKFYRSSNAILSRLGNQRNPAVALNLIESVALPVLTFSLEALRLNKSEAVSIDHPWCRTFMKLYWTFDNSVVRECQMYGGFLPLTYLICIKQMSFINKLFFTENAILIDLAIYNGTSEMNDIAKKYNSDSAIFRIKYSDIIRRRFVEDNSA
jgi:exonuclease III